MTAILSSTEASTRAILNFDEGSAYTHAYTRSNHHRLEFAEAR